MFFILSSADCSPGCMNGGTCVAPDDCECVEGWEGQHCQEGIVSVLCITMFSNNSLIAQCDRYCGDHGSCVRPNTCECQPGWHGRRCEKRKCNTCNDHACNHLD